jgi:hypothetical protein
VGFKFNLSVTMPEKGLCTISTFRSHSHLEGRGLGYKVIEALDFNFLCNFTLVQIIPSHHYPLFVRWHFFLFLQGIIKDPSQPLQQLEYIGTGYPSQLQSIIPFSVTSFHLQCPQFCTLLFIKSYPEESRKAPPLFS